MALERTAFKIEKDTWIEMGTPYQYDMVKYDGRKVVDVAIGIEKQPGGEVYVSEPFFMDILPMVFEKKVTVHLDMYSDPPVVLEQNGRLVLHNADMDYVKDVVEKALDETYISNQIRAITELRMNQYNASGIGRTTKILREQLSGELDRKINYAFLKLFLREKYQLSDMTKESPVALDISRLDKNELISLYGGILEYRKTNGAKFEPLKSLLQKDYTLSEMEAALKEDITRRFFAGEIH